MMYVVEELVPVRCRGSRQLINPERRLSLEGSQRIRTSSPAENTSEGFVERCSTCTNRRSASAKHDLERHKEGEKQKATVQERKMRLQIRVDTARKRTKSDH
jgi:hypothetical protein